MSSQAACLVWLMNSFCVFRCLGGCVPGWTLWADSSYSCLNSLRGSVTIIRLAAFSLGAGKVLGPPSRGEGCHALVVEKKRTSQHKACNAAGSNLFHVLSTYEVQSASTVSFKFSYLSTSVSE